MACELTLKRRRNFDRLRIGNDRNFKTLAEMLKIQNLEIPFFLCGQSA